MIGIIKGKINIYIQWSVVSILMLLTIFGGCKTHEKPFTIGVLVDVSNFGTVIEGFKTGMAELGYVEGKNVKYIYDGILENNQNIIDAEIKKLLSQDVDLLLPVGNLLALRAKKVVEGTDMPVLFSTVSKPIESGLVSSLSHPGGNATGVTNTDSTTKALEFLKMITPGLKKVYLPYNPDDEISITCLPAVDKAASQLKIELVFHKVRSVEEAVAAIKALPKDVDAIFRIPSPTLDSRDIELSQAAIERRLPMGSRVPLDKAVLMTYSDNLFNIGKQTARLANEIRKGAKPADLPVETSETYLTVNLITAEKIGLHIQDDILAQARIIIHQ
jgi:putative tryptophan/tyrosine transport system substrate-binding protein